MDTASLATLPVSRAHPARAIHYSGPEGAYTLRPMRMGDASAMFAAVEESLLELRRFMPWAHLPRTPLSQLERLRLVENDYFAGRDLQMGLFLEDGTFAATCGLHFRVPINARGVECGYWTRSSQSGRGLATLGLRLLTLYAVDKLDCDRVQVLHHEHNLASRRVIEKCGYRFETVMRNLTTAPTPEMIASGHVSTRNTHVWAIVPDDLQALDWPASMRVRMRYVNMAGHAL